MSVLRLKSKTQLTIIPNEAPVVKEFIAPSIKIKVKIAIDHVVNVQGVIQLSATIAH